MAEQAGKNYTDAQNEELEEINKLEKQIADYNKGLPENTPENPQNAGTEVKIPSNWYTTTPTYVSTEDGTVVKKSVKISSVTAIATGNGETVPVPIGFWYVGGNLTTGVVISDNQNDKNKYAGKTDQQGNAYVGKDLEGNQFVWIPCVIDDYKKYDVWNGKTQYYTSSSSNSLANANWDKMTNSAEKTQIQKYSGFYVARYEAGLATTIEEYTTKQQHTGSNQVYNKKGIPQSKEGVIPWILIDWIHAQINAQSMYNTSYVHSGLITGTQWDVMINKIAEVEGKSLINSKNWGNFNDTTLTYTGRYSIYDTKTNYVGVFSEKQISATKNADTCTLLTTGSTEMAKAYNLYDVAGNAVELTEEISFYGGNSSTQYREYRGGGCHGNSSLTPVSVRYGNVSTTYTGPSVGFRVVLYIK